MSLGDSATDESRSIVDRSATAIDLIALFSMDIPNGNFDHQGVVDISVNRQLTPKLLYSIYNHDENKPSPHLASFCFPSSSWTKFVSAADAPPPPVDVQQHSFVLNVFSGIEMYGCCLVKYVQLKLSQIAAAEAEEESKLSLSPRSEFALYYPVAIVLLSKFPLYETFAKKLASFAVSHEEIFDDERPDVQKQSVHRLYEILKGANYPHLRLGSGYSSFEVPPEVDSELLFKYLHFKTVIAIFTALLSESSVVILSNRVADLVPVMESLKSLMYPLKWIFTFLPLLPQGFEDILDTPQPIFVGMLKESFKADYPALRETIVVDLEENSIKFPFNYKGSLLPTRLSSKLVEGLGSLIVEDKKEENFRYSVRNMGKVRQEFLSVMASLLEGYHKYVIGYGLSAAQLRQRSLKKLFDEEKFLNQAPPFYCSFQESLVQTQAFQQFIEDRYSSVIENKTEDDEFEKALAKRKKKRSHALKKLTQMEKRGSLWMQSSSMWTTWKRYDIDLEGKCMYKLERKNSFACSNNALLGCAGETTRKLICRLDTDLKVRIVEFGSRNAGEIRSLCTPYAFEIVNVGSSTRKVNLLFCTDSEQDLKQWVDAVFSKIVVSERRTIGPR